ncbi:hypothetical protein AA309_24120 [Microvirga vignae]|uniref:Uncharacterized protein n=2 Tax=Microvirga vignae TaxID=1225564 RepID=A0A0H1R625_9HYPH|nr:hypothetical protein AA309_24120 [Microvirga vignae]
MSVALLAATSFSGAADARPGKSKGYAYGHYKNGKAQAYVVRRRNNNAAIAAGVTGAIVGGVLGATARPTYRTYEPSYRYYEAPRRSYYREEYYDYGY